MAPIAAPIASDRGVGVGEPERDERRARSRAARASAASTPRRTSTAADRATRVRRRSRREPALHRGADFRHRRPRRGTTASRGSGDRSGSRTPRSATPPRRPPQTDRCAAGSVGPNRLTVGVPTAVAMCSGPVSPDTTSADARESATRSARPVGGAAIAASGRGGDHLRPRAPPRRVPTARPASARRRRAGTPRARRSAPAATACSATPRRG